MLEQNYRPEIHLDGLEASSKHRQRRQMLVALAVMLMAMILVVKYGQSWFDWLLTAGTEQARPSMSDTKGGQPTPATSRRARSKQAGASVTRTTVSDASIERRAVLAPLSVEVVYAGGRRTIRTHDSSSLNLPPSSPAAAPEVDAAPKEDAAPKADAVPKADAALRADAGPSPSAPMTEAADRVRLSPETVKAVEHPVTPRYPLLAKKMNVQGSVVLLASIDKDGAIQDLQVLSGPDILAAAAQEAVRQWRFRPHLDNGQPVPTEARVTVNFSISTH
jgi:TonB family protein